ncbi:hypothetical protein [Neisseria meningitidis]
MLGRNGAGKSTLLHQRGNQVGMRTDAVGRFDG